MHVCLCNKSCNSISWTINCMHGFDHRCQMVFSQEHNEGNEKLSVKLRISHRARHCWQQAFIMETRKLTVQPVCTHSKSHSQSFTLFLSLPLFLQTNLNIRFKSNQFMPRYFHLTHSSLLDWIDDREKNITH